MQSGQDRSAPAPYFSSAGLRIGARYALATAAGACAFALAFGTLAAQKGLSLVEATLMSALVFAGASQLVAMEIWTTPMTPAVIVTLALVTGVVNLRLVLMGASFRPWLAALPPAKVYPTLLLTTDSSWIMGIRHRAEGGADASVLLGSGLTLWIFWVGSTALGYLFGGLIPDPRRFGLDLILPIFFVAMLVPLWRGPRRAIPWVIAGAVALAVQATVPGFWFIVAGSLSGAIAGGFIDERK
ncbi:MAG: AzlC family ABC transporter permease [Pseudorhodoplanes sp.]|nr:AzlC family ABC transporter permease [Pseudorhodoplanes sp.]